MLSQFLTLHSCASRRTCQILISHCCFQFCGVFKCNYSQNKTKKRKAARSQHSSSVAYLGLYSGLSDKNCNQIRLCSGQQRAQLLDIQSPVRLRQLGRSFQFNSYKPGNLYVLRLYQNNWLLFLFDRLKPCLGLVTLLSCLLDRFTCRLANKQTTVCLFLQFICLYQINK